jgi:RNA polymerase sigma factor (sigma-70 family)
MNFRYRLEYDELSDRQIVEKILAEPHDEDAAAYLLHVRYAPLINKIYKRFTKDDTWFDDCVDELFIHLKGKDCTWHALGNFEWRSTLGYWLKGVAWHRFRDVLPKMIENGGLNVSIDNNDPKKPKVQITDEGEGNYDRRLRKVLLMEAISKLDEDQRFVIQKRLEGYNSREIAILLQNKWQTLGIQKYNNKKEPVVPDSGYVDVHIQRAKKMLRIIMSN